MIKKKNLSGLMSLAGAGIAVATLVAFCIYGVVYDYFDTGVVGALLIGAACGCVYTLCDGKWTKMLNLAAILVDGIGLGVFFLNSYYVWADRLNHIEMYGARGTLTPVIFIIVLFVLSILAYTASCFAGKEEMK